MQDDFPDHLDATHTVRIVRFGGYFLLEFRKNGQIFKKFRFKDRQSTRDTLRKSGVRATGPEMVGCALQYMKEYPEHKGAIIEIHKPAAWFWS